MNLKSEFDKWLMTNSVGPLGDEKVEFKITMSKHSSINTKDGISDP
jgi:hypothetical protein